MHAGEYPNSEYDALVAGAGLAGAAPGALPYCPCRSAKFSSDGSRMAVVSLDRNQQRESLLATGDTPLLPHRQRTYDHVTRPHAVQACQQQQAFEAGNTSRSADIADIEVCLCGSAPRRPQFARRCSISCKPKSYDRGRGGGACPVFYPCTNPSDGALTVRGFLGRRRPSRGWRGAEPVPHGVPGQLQQAGQPHPGREHPLRQPRPAAAGLLATRAGPIKRCGYFRPPSILSASETVTVVVVPLYPSTLKNHSITTRCGIFSIGIEAACSSVDRGLDTRLFLSSVSATAGKCTWTTVPFQFVRCLGIRVKGLASRAPDAGVSRWARAAVFPGDTNKAREGVAAV